MGNLYKVVVTGPFNVGKTEFLAILEWLLPKWNHGLKRHVSDRPFSIYTLHYRAKQIVELWRTTARDTPPAEKEEKTPEEIEKFKESLGEFGDLI